MEPEFEKLLAESGWIRGLAQRLVQDEHAAEDVSQDVIQAAWAEGPALEGPPLRAWLATVTWRFAKKRIDREAHRRVIERDHARAESFSSDPSERLALHRLLVDAVDSLPPLQREVVLLRYFDGKRPREIARQLGTTSETVRARLSRGLRLLRERLDRDACPGSSQEGRALWCAAFTEHLVPAGVPLGASVFSAVSTLAMTKILLPVTALLVLFGLFWKLQSADGSYPSAGPVEVSNTEPLVDPPETQMAAAEAQVSRRSLADEGSLSARTRSVTVRVRSEDGSALRGQLAFLQTGAGSAFQVELDEEGRGAFSGQGEAYRVYAGAEGHAPGWIEVAPTDDSVELELEALLSLRGRWIEDGGAPPHPVRWTAHVQHDDFGAAPRIKRALIPGPAKRVVRTGEGGQFLLDGVRRGSDLRVELPHSHVFEERDSFSIFDDEERLIRISGDPIELRTMRRPSIVARVVRADDGRPVPNAAVAIRSVNEFGRLAGEFDDDTDENGVASNSVWVGGAALSHWSIMSPAERRDTADRYPRIRYEIVPVQADLLPVMAFADAPATGYCYELGTIALPVLAVREVRIVDASGRGLPGAVVQVAESPPAHADENGVARVPARLFEEHGCRALASGYAPGALEASQVPPEGESADAPVLALRPGTEVQLTLPSSVMDPSKMRLEYTWDRTPFEILPSTEYAYEYELLEALLGYDGIFHINRIDSRDPLASARAFAGFDGSGIARIPSLRPGGILFVAVREPNRFEHARQRIEVPASSGVHRIELKYDPADVEAAPTWKVRGTVRDDAGRPLRAVEIDWHYGGNDGPRGTETTNGEGVFAFPAALCSEERGAGLRLTIKKGGFYSKRISLSDEPSDPLEVVLGCSRRVDIRVRDRGGRSLITSQPPYGHRRAMANAERLGVGHFVDGCFPYGPREFVFDVGLVTYTRELTEGQEWFEFELPAHGQLVAEFLDPPDRFKLAGTLRRVGVAEPSSRAVEVSTRAPRFSYDLLPGAYEVELEGRPPRRFDVRPGETVRIDLGAD